MSKRSTINYTLAVIMSVLAFLVVAFCLIGCGRHQVMRNHLAGETSPYLLQHADNPVDWYPWGDEALNRAQTEDKPILLSIGYSACHWCHVMEQESFENEEIASLMNESFINIKVDREERPDLDSIYMQAVVAMTGRGGWPLTVFLTPEGKPFFGGTYFPPDSLSRVLKDVANTYHNHRGDIEETTEQLLAGLSKFMNPDTSDVTEPLVMDTLEQAYSGLERVFDEENGGFGAAPKFPQPMALEFLLSYFHRTGNIVAFEIVDVTLDKMAKGGIYDQIGGGFHRYTTDKSWLVPHFEKMLYDNALLSKLYLNAYLVTGKGLYRSVTEETLDYVLREMTDPQGGFYSTQDADSEGVEGKYYLWTPQEISDVLGEEVSQIIRTYFDVTAEGNFEGKNILYVTDDQPAVSSVIEEAKASLLERREQRIKPGRDEKILASWNGLMLASLAEAACVLDRQDYLAAATANGSFLVDSMVVNGYLKHSYNDGNAKIDGFLDDYALVIDGLLILHQATFEGKWLRQAIRLAEVMISQFWDEETNMFYDTSKEQEDLFIRPRNMFDRALPSGSSAATLVLLKLATITGNEQFQEVAIQSLRLMQIPMHQNPLSFGNWLCALDFYLSTPKEIAIIGPRDDPATVELLQTICTIWLPNKVVVAYDPNDPAPVLELKLIEGRQMINNQPTVYVCEQYICHIPVTDPVSLSAQLRGD